MTEVSLFDSMSPTQEPSDLWDFEIFLDEKVKHVLKRWKNFMCAIVRRHQEQDDVLWKRNWMKLWNCNDALWKRNGCDVAEFYPLQLPRKLTCVMCVLWFMGKKHNLSKSLHTRKCRKKRALPCKILAYSVDRDCLSWNSSMAFHLESGLHSLTALDPMRFCIVPGCHKWTASRNGTMWHIQAKHPNIFEDFGEKTLFCALTGTGIIGTHRDCMRSHRQAFEEEIVSVVDEAMQSALHTDDEYIGTDDEWF